MTVYKRAIKAAIQKNNTLSSLITRRLKSLICLHGNQTKPKSESPWTSYQGNQTPVCTSHTALQSFPQAQESTCNNWSTRHRELLSQSRLSKIQQHLVPSAAQRTGAVQHHHHLPWKHSRYSSLCPAGFTWMILTGKLLVEAANTAEAKVWSFLSKNSAKRMEKNTLICTNFFS